MAKAGIKHIDVGTELTKTEWESEETHELLHGTSFPGSPVERQLFYRDDEHKWYIYNGTDWVWLGGGGGGMEVHGNEYHDPDFATEAALAAHEGTQTAGVHGSTSSATTNKLMHRDAYGRAKVAAPLASDDIARKAEVDAKPSTFLGLSDTPASYSGQAGKLAKVKATEDGLEFGVGGGGMEVHGNEYHDPDFATEAALAAAKPKIILDVYLYNGGTHQQLPTGQNIVVMLDTEVTDSENAFDSSVKAGTTTATSAGHLIDTTLNPFVPGDVGRKVWNTTDDTYTYITAYNSPSDVSVYNDIFTLGEGYKAYFAKFVAPSAMEVVVFTKCDVRFLADGKYLQFQILKNSSTAASELRYFSGASQLGLINMSAPVILAANDEIQVAVAQDTGSKQFITAASGGATFMRIVKLRDL